MKSIVFLAVFGLISIQLSAQVGIGTSTPHASAKLEVSSTTQGFLPPRVSLTATNAASPVTSPETGLLVYNIAPNGSGVTAVTPGFYYWGGSAWVRLIVPTDNAANVTGTVAVANGGTGATTLTGILKGNGTSAFTPATAGTDYLAPNGSAANLTNFPTLNQNTTGTAANVSGTVAVANGGTGATTLTGILKGNGTSAFTAAVAGTDYQAALTNPVTGTGTSNYLPKFTGSTTVGNSQIFDNATSVGIGTALPSSTAAFEIKSSNKGFLPPRMTTTERNAIVNPVVGLMIYNSTTDAIEFVKRGGETLDANNTTTNQTSSAGDGAYQSFTAIANGKISSIEVNLRNPASDNTSKVNVKVYAGAGINGTLLASSIDITPTSNYSFNKFFFHDNFATITAGSTYTILVTPVGSTSNFTWISQSGYSAYNGGQMGYPSSGFGDWDMGFKVNISSPSWIAL